MSKLLYNTQPLVVDPDLAELIGLNEAIVLQQIHYWIMNNSKANRNYKDGFYWTFNSYPNWKKQFPFWSIETIKRIFTNLEKANLIITDSFNALKIDRTKWYRIDYNALAVLVNPAPIISGNGEVNMTRPSGQNDLMGENSGFPGFFHSDDRIWKAKKA